MSHETFQFLRPSLEPREHKQNLAGAWTNRLFSIVWQAVLAMPLAARLELSLSWKAVVDRRW